MDWPAKRYNFTSSPLFLGTFFLFLISVTQYSRISSLNDIWITSLMPFTQKFAQSEWICKIILGVLYFSIVFLLHKINSKILTIGKEKLLLPLVYLIFAFASSTSMKLSGTLPSAIFIFLSIYCTILAHKDEKCIFLAGFFIALAILSDPRFVFLFPLPIIFIFSGRGLSFREFIILFLSLLLPLVVTASTFQLVTGNLYELTQLFIKRLEFSQGSLIIKDSPVGYAILFVCIILAVISLTNVLSGINRVKILKAMALYRFIALLFGLLITYLIYPSLSESFAPVIALPMSILVSEAISSREASSSGRVLFFVFLILLTIKKIYFFI